MYIELSSEPSGRYFQASYIFPQTLKIDGFVLPPISTLLLFHIISGKYLAGYDKNGNRQFYLLLSQKITSITINNNTVKLNKELYNTEPHK